MTTSIDPVEAARTVHRPAWRAGAAAPPDDAATAAGRFHRDGPLTRVIIPCARGLARYFRIQVHGEALIPRDRPVIYVGKHPRTLWYAETLVLGLVTFWDSDRPPFRVLEQPRTTVHRAPVLGWMRRHVAAIPADADSALAALAAGESLLIFPGGTRELYGAPDVLKWHGRTGFVRLAALAQVPIVPFAIVGADQQHPGRLWLSRSRRLSLWLPPFPLPVPLDYWFAAPIAPPPSASPAAIAAHAAHVREVTSALLASGLAARRPWWPLGATPRHGRDDGAMPPNERQPMFSAR